MAQLPIEIDNLFGDNNIDKSYPKVVFLLGAGASVTAGVPDTRGFVTDFMDYLAEKKPQSIYPVFRDIISKLTSWKKEKIDVELLLETLLKLKNHEEEPLLRFCMDATMNLPEYDNKIQLDALLKDYIRLRTIVKESNIWHLEPLKDFIDQSRPLSIITLNYDTCIEQFCNATRLNYTDGFDIHWNPSNYKNKDVDVHLYKLHGSVIWYESDRGDYIKLPIKPQDGGVQLITDERATNLMLYPMQKSNLAEPLMELLLLTKKLLENECDILIIVGYSFRDEHIKKMLLDAARLNRKMKVLLIDPMAGKIYREKLQYYNGDFPSSLEGRVILIPFRFDHVFEHLHINYIEKLIVASREEQQFRKNEIKGSIYGWQSLLNLYVDANDIEKATKVYHKIQPSELEKDWRILLKYYIKYVVYWLLIRKNSAPETTLNKLHDILYSKLIEGLEFNVNNNQEIEYLIKNDDKNYCNIEDIYNIIWDSMFLFLEDYKNTGNIALFVKILDELLSHLSIFKKNRMKIADYSHMDLVYEEGKEKEEKLANNILTFERSAISSILFKIKMFKPKKSKK